MLLFSGNHFSDLVAQAFMYSEKNYYSTTKIMGQVRNLNTSHEGACTVFLFAVGDTCGLHATILRLIRKPFGNSYVYSVITL